MEALIPQSPAAATGTARAHEIPLDIIDANPNQPRKSFDDERIRSLSESIRTDGVLQPVVVRRKGERYELVMGERRLKAARLAGVETVPVVVKDVQDMDSLRLALVENIQREDLNAIEVAQAYRELMGSFGLSQAELAQLVGKDRSSVANSVRLLNLPEPVQRMIVDGEITGGHARALLSLTTGSEQVALAKKIVAKNMSVRKAEEEAGLGQAGKKTKTRRAKEKPTHIAYLEKELSSHLGTRVHVDEKRGGKGKITIEFYSHEEFERLAEMMSLPLPR